MRDKLKILYVDMGGVAVYSMDKTAGRILGWTDTQNDVFLLVPGLIKETVKKEIIDISKSPQKIKIVSLPFSNKKMPSSLGIIVSYLLRILFSPAILFKKLPCLDLGYSNSPVLVDVIPILLLKLFGKCRHWVLMFDSIVPHPGKRSGSAFINTITYAESKLVTILARAFASAVFTVNPELKEEIIKLGINEKNIFLSKNGLFINRIDGAVVNTNNKKYDAAYMGRITENKGVFDLISVWKEVVKKHPAVKLAVMGTGRSEVVENFQRSIKKNNLESNVEYLGYTGGDKKYGVLKSSKIFIFLSKVNADESWGITLMEALACGLPSITYDLAIYKHVYDEGILQKNAIGDIDSVVKKTIFLLDNQWERLKLSAKSAEFARNFSWSEIARNDLEIINNIIS